MDGSGGTSATALHGTDSYGMPLSSSPSYGYSPHHPHHFQFAASSSASLTQTHAHETTGALGATQSSPSLSCFAFDEGVGRMLKQQNDLILQR